MAEVLLKDWTAKNENEDVKEVLCFEIRHNDGKYRLSVIKENVNYNKQYGYTSRQFIVFADGNFSTTLGMGRKSAKKLEILNNLVEEMKDDMTTLWKDGQYQPLVNKFCDRVRSKKVFG